MIEYFKEELTTTALFLFFTSGLDISRYFPDCVMISIRRGFEYRAKMKIELF